MRVFPPNTVNLKILELQHLEFPEFQLVGIQPDLRDEDFKFIMVGSDPGRKGAGLLGYTSLAQAQDITAKIMRKQFDRNNVPYEAMLGLNAFPWRLPYTVKANQMLKKNDPDGGFTRERHASIRILAVLFSIKPDLPVIAVGDVADEQVTRARKKREHIFIPHPARGAANFSMGQKKNPPKYRDALPGESYDQFIDRILGRYAQ